MPAHTVSSLRTRNRRNTSSSEAQHRDHDLICLPRSITSSPQTGQARTRAPTDIRRGTRIERGMTSRERRSTRRSRRATTKIRVVKRDCRAHDQRTRKSWLLTPNGSVRYQEPAYPMYVHWAGRAAPPRSPACGKALAGQPGGWPSFKTNKPSASAAPLSRRSTLAVALHLDHQAAVIAPSPLLNLVHRAH